MPGLREQDSGKTEAVRGTEIALRLPVSNCVNDDLTADQACDTTFKEIDGQASSHATGRKRALDVVHPIHNNTSGVRMDERE